MRRRAALEDALRSAIRGGRLAAGVRLPSSRVLATELGVARNTVADAYGQLVAEGWLEARQGSGTRVAVHGVETVVPGSAAVGAAGGSVRFDLSPGVPTLAGFPRSGWNAAARRAMTDAADECFGYPDPRGHPGLRRALVEYLARVRGVRAAPEQIIICSGFRQGLALLADVLRRAGTDRVAVESHGVVIHHDVLRANGISTCPVPVDEYGARTDELGDCGAALLTPAHQFPLGVALSPERRNAAIGWARERSAWLLEDDYDGEFRYDRRPIGALQALAPDRVVYLGTASKSLAPAVGLGWIVAPAALVEELVEAKRRADGFTGVLEQLTLEQFLRSGGYDRHVRRCRLRYQQRREQLLAAMADTGATVTGIAAGLHAMVGLLDLPASEEPRLRHRAAAMGLRIRTLTEFTAQPDPAASAAVVVGYSRPSDSALAPALDLLARTLR
ncbi:MocR-like pyridoxine biosynthesis transcription factor PdxR [Nocardia terrae]|uniref:MocR-like pyridoxine biosynthesis transcription factor PdxR n=1 Tax=Nocardia terrae TaxID=2675851 RepID=UPI002E259968